MLKPAFNSEKEYRKYGAVSQSSLWWLNTHPKTYYKKVIQGIKEPVPSYFKFGSALDCYLTSPEEFNDTYGYSLGKAPKGKLGIFCDRYLYYYGSMKMNKEISLTKAYEESEYSWTLNKVLEKFYSDEVQIYIKESLSNKNKTVLDKDTFDLIKKIGVHIKEFPNTAKYFNKLFRDHNKEYYYQFSFTFDVNNTKCKGLIDLLVVDTVKKEIEIIDLKTMGKPLLEFKNGTCFHNFTDSFIKYGYYLQASFYTEGIQQYISNLKDRNGVNYSEYTILPFKFIVAESFKVSDPVEYICSKDYLFIGKKGLKGFFFQGKYLHIKGFEQLISELNWHKITNYWEHSKDTYDSNFSFNLESLIS